MKHKNYSLVIELIAIIIIPQLIFWGWIAPVTGSRLAVYIGGTILNTVAIPILLGVTYCKSGLRTAAALIVCCCVLEIAVFILSALLWVINVSVRSVVFAFVIIALIGVAVLTPFYPALKKKRTGVYPIDDTDDSDDNFPSVQ